MSAAKSVEILPITTNASFSASNANSNDSPRQKPRAHSSSSISRPVDNATAFPNLNSMQQNNTDSLLSNKQQHHVAFRDQLIDNASPVRRLSVHHTNVSSRPAYFSQVTLQPASGNLKAAIADDKAVSANETAFTHQLLPSAIVGTKDASMAPLSAENTSAQAFHPTPSVSSLQQQHSRDLTDAPGFATLFAPLYQVGNASVQLRRSIELYQAKLTKARRRLEEEQVEREKALNVYLRYAVNAASADERAKRKEEFQRRNTKYSSNINHLERKIVEYKTKIDHLSAQLAASTGSSGTSSESQPTALANLTSNSMNAETNDDSVKLPTQLQNNKWKSATLPPGYVMPKNASKLFKSTTDAGSIIRKAVVGPPAAAAAHQQRAVQLHSASSVNLSRLETSPLQQQQQQDHQLSKRVSESGDSSTEHSSVYSAMPASLQNRLRDGKLALSLRDSASSTTNNSASLSVGGFSSLRGKSKDDSALSSVTSLGASTTAKQSLPQSVGLATTSGGDTSRKSGSTRWYHTGLGESSAKTDQNYASADITQPGLLDDEQVSVSSIGTGSRGNGTAASGGDNSSDNVLRQRFDRLIHEMGDIRGRLDNWNMSFDIIREHSDNQFAKLSQALDENLWKSRALESQLADVVELRRADVDSFRHAVEEMEERISYQIQERLRDMQENVDRLDTRFALMEHTQAREKALLSLESIQNSTTQQMLFKLLNVVLAVLQFVIVLGSSVAAMIAPIFDSKLSFFVATLVVAMAFVVANSVDSLSDLLNPVEFVKACVKFMLGFSRSADDNDNSAVSKTADFVKKPLPVS